MNLTELNELRNELDNMLNDKLSDPNQMKTLMNHYKISGLYQYSFYNSMLIMLQGGTICNSFAGWKRLNRYVKKGQKAHISIIRPYIKKSPLIDKDGKTLKDKDGKILYDETFSRFGSCLVFDINQTDGEPLKFDHNSTDKTNLNYKDLKNLIMDSTCLIIDEDQIAPARGICTNDKIVISSLSNNTDKIKTLFHELGHYFFEHYRSYKPKSIKEVEAEAVSSLLLSFYDIRFELSQSYIDFWKKSDTISEVDKSGIIKITEKIIKILTPKPVQSKSA